RGLAGAVATRDARGKPRGSSAGVRVAAAGAPAATAESIVGGLAQGWKAGATLALKPEAEKALATLLAKVSATGKGSVVRLASSLGSRGLEKAAGEVVKSLVATLADEKASLAD